MRLLCQLCYDYHAEVATQTFCAPIEFIQLLPQLLCKLHYRTVADKINMLLNGLDRVQAAYSVCLFIRCVIIKSDWIMLINVSADVLKKVKYSSPR